MNIQAVTSSLKLPLTRDGQCLSKSSCWVQFSFFSCAYSSVWLSPRVL